VLSLELWEQEVGLVAACAGNHGQGVALAGKLVNAPVIVFASDHASPVKIEKMRALGAEVRLVTGGYEQAEAAGLHYATEHGKTWVSPYNDAQVVAGQGTIGLEILQQAELPPGTRVVVPVSGGGLIAGIAAALEGRPLRVVGAQAEVAPFMHALLTRGTQDGLPDLPSLADGLTGAVEATSITIPIVQRCVNEIMLVNEDEIARGLAFAFHKYSEIIEPSAAVGLAALLTGKIQAPAVIVISGGNMAKEQHAGICARYAEVG